MGLKVNQGSTREEMWEKILRLRQKNEELKILADHAFRRNTELINRIKTIRKIVNQEGRERGN